MSLDLFTPLQIPRLTGTAEHAQRESATRRGHADGYAAGMRAAREDAQREAERADAERRGAADAARGALRDALSALDRAVASLAARTDAVAELAEERVMVLAVELTETILDRELADPVRSALTAAARARGVIEVGDEAVMMLGAQDVATLDRLGERPQGIRCEASSELRPGDAVVRVPDGEVDLRVEAALRRVRAVLAEVN